MTQRDLAGLASRAAAAGLRVRASAGWPESTSDGTPPALPGFIDSSFSPLVAAAADRCLRRYHGAPPADPARGARTAVVLLSPLGDVASAVRVAHAVDTGGRVAPLMFYQSVPNAVAGHVAATWGLAGPVVCLGNAEDGVDVASLLIDDGDADEALIVLARQSYPDPAGDRATAVLVADEGEQP